MKTPKSPLSSMTIWGAIITAIPTILQLLRIAGLDLQVSADDLTSLIQQIVEVVTQVIGLITVYRGRARADTPLKPLLGS